MGKASKGLNTQVMAPESDTLPPPPHAAGTCACVNKCRVKQFPESRQEAHVRAPDIHTAPLLYSKPIN